jgi:GrpB-like predicted nucleotidyltransferase (UPF0157 family)
MNNEPPFALVDPERAREEAERLFEAVSKSLDAILPPTADIRHIGATALHGCLTKGDLDIVVRVPAVDFQAADAALASRYARNDGSIRTTTFSAFEDSSSRPHLGIQLAVIDGPSDFFHQFVEALRQSPPLVEEYNTLKRAYDGSAMATYRVAKDAFVERVLAEFRSGRTDESR